MDDNPYTPPQTAPTPIDLSTRPDRHFRMPIDDGSFWKALITLLALMALYLAVYALAR
jgi:hypothetical protein